MDVMATYRELAQASDNVVVRNTLCVSIIISNTSNVR